MTMTRLDIWDDEGEGDENRPPVTQPHSLQSLLPARPLTMTWTGSLDLEEIAESLVGLSVEDAEEEAKAALNRATDLASDADVLAVLLTVFKADRESAIHGDDTWERPLEYSKRMCSLCDRNFLSGGQPRPDDFPARVVASIYAECGRAYALAGETSQAHSLLQKALNVFGIIREPSMDEALEISACRASMARVLKRLGQLKGAQDEFLQAMQILAELPDSFEVPGLVSEYCEALAAAEASAVVSAQLLELILQLVEEKFGESSDEHLKALQELSEACLAVQKPALAAPLLLKLSMQLREYYGSTAWAAEIQTVEEKAAAALEAGAAEYMQNADFEAASSMWSSAIQVREALHTEENLLTEMRSSLTALQLAASGSEAGATTREPEAFSPESEDTGQESTGHEAPENWDEVVEETRRPKPSLSQPLQSLRPAWHAPTAPVDAWD